MIWLYSVELHNFKSYDGKNTIFFHPEFSTVIGPNGSGKSNLIDGLIQLLS